MQRQFTQDVKIKKGTYTSDGMPIQPGEFISSGAQNRPSNYLFDESTRLNKFVSLNANRNNIPDMRLYAVTGSGNPLSDMSFTFTNDSVNSKITVSTTTLARLIYGTGDQISAKCYMVIPFSVAHPPVSTQAFIRVLNHTDAPLNLAKDMVLVLENLAGAAFTDSVDYFAEDVINYATDSGTASAAQKIRVRYGDSVTISQLIALLNTVEYTTGKLAFSAILRTEGGAAEDPTVKTAFGGETLVCKYVTPATAFTFTNFNDHILNRFFNNNGVYSPFKYDPADKVFTNPGIYGFVFEDGTIDMKGMDGTRVIAEDDTSTNFVWLPTTSAPYTTTDATAPAWYTEVNALGNQGSSHFSANLIDPDINFFPFVEVSSKTIRFSNGLSLSLDYLLGIPGSYTCNMSRTTDMDNLRETKILFDNGTDVALYNYFVKSDPVIANFDQRMAIPTIPNLFKGISKYLRDVIFVDNFIIANNSDLKIFQTLNDAFSSSAFYPGITVVLITRDTYTYEWYNNIPAGVRFLVLTPGPLDTLVGIDDKSFHWGELTVATSVSLNLFLSSGGDEYVSFDDTEFMYNTSVTFKIRSSALDTLEKTISMFRVSAYEMIFTQESGGTGYLTSLTAQQCSIKSMVVESSLAIRTINIRSTNQEQGIASLEIQNQYAVNIMPHVVANADISCSSLCLVPPVSYFKAVSNSKFNVQLCTWVPLTSFCITPAGNELYPIAFIASGTSGFVAANLDLIIDCAPVSGRDSLEARNRALIQEFIYVAETIVDSNIKITLTNYWGLNKTDFLAGTTTLPKDFMFINCGADFLNNDSTRFGGYFEGGSLRLELSGVPRARDYSGTKAYVVNDVVYDSGTGSTYVCKAAGTGWALSDTAYWYEWDKAGHHLFSQDLFRNSTCVFYFCNTNISNPLVQMSSGLNFSIETKPAVLTVGAAPSDTYITWCPEHRTGVRTYWPLTGGATIENYERHAVFVAGLRHGEVNIRSLFIHMFFPAGYALDSTYQSRRLMPEGGPTGPYVIENSYNHPRTSIVLEAEGTEINIGFLNTLLIPDFSERKLASLALLHNWGDPVLVFASARWEHTSFYGALTIFKTNYNTRFNIPRWVNSVLLSTLGILKCGEFRTSCYFLTTANSTQAGHDDLPYGWLETGSCADSYIEFKQGDPNTFMMYSWAGGTKTSLSALLPDAERAITALDTTYPKPSELLNNVYYTGSPYAIPRVPSLSAVPGSDGLVAREMCIKLGNLDGYVHPRIDPVVPTTKMYRYNLTQNCEINVIGTLLIAADFAVNNIVRGLSVDGLYVFDDHLEASNGIASGTVMKESNQTAGLAFITEPDAFVPYTVV